MDDAQKGANARLTIDLEEQTITRPDGSTVHVRHRSVPQALPAQRARRYRPHRAEGARAIARVRGRRTARRQPWLWARAQCAAERKLLMLPGDGIGPEVMRQVVARHRMVRPQAHRAASRSARVWSAAAPMTADGTPLTDATMAQAHEADAVLLGAVGGPKWDKLPFAQRPERGLLRLRKDMDLFANLRPALVFEPLIGASTLKPEVIDGLDIMIMRELTGGVYFGEPRGIETLPDGSAAASTPRSIPRPRSCASPASPSSWRASARNKVCSVEKANVMESGVLWREEVQKLHDAEYPDVELSHMYADNCAMQLVRNPKQFDVIVTDNLFGDILSDCAAMLTGSLGMLPSASLGAADRAAGARRSTSRCTARRPTSPARSRRIRWPAMLSLRDDAALFLRHRRNEADDARDGGAERARARRAHQRHPAARHRARLDHGDGRHGAARTRQAGLREEASMIVVTGGNGGLGRQIVRALQERIGNGFIVTVRDTAKAADLAAQGIAVRAGDFDKADEVARAIEGGDTILLMATLGTTEQRVKQYKNVIDAAKRQGTKRIAFVGYLADQPKSPFPSTPSILQTLAYLKRAGLRADQSAQRQLCRSGADDGDPRAADRARSCRPRAPAKFPMSRAAISPAPRRAS